MDNKTTNNLILDLFRPDGEYTFLVGAGISMNPPSNIPSAIMFVKTILELCAPKEEIEIISSLQHLRYELLIEKFKIYFDTELHFLDYLELMPDPNLIHFFLASVLIHKQYLVTTNFDFMIERALQRTLLPTEQYKIVPVITKADFEKNFRPYDLVEVELCPIYKIHGSKKNIITNEDTTSSLITTMGALGKDRSIGETFSLEEYKQQPFYNLVKGRILVVMGYSGSDDFDIGPMLKKLPAIESLIWIEHSFNEETIYQPILPKDDTIYDETLPKVKSTDLLQEIANTTQIKVYQVFSNTHNFVKNILWPHILPDFPLLIDDFPKSPNEILPFNKWLQHEFQSELPTEIGKLEFVCSLYADFNQWKSLERCADRGLAVSKKKSDFNAQMKFLNYLGKAYMKLDNFYSALQQFKDGIEIAGNTSQLEYMATFINNVGVISNKMRYIMDSSQMAATLEMFENALMLFEQNQNQWGKLACLTNVAGIEFYKGNFMAANKALMDAYAQTQHMGNLNYKSAISYDFGIFCEFLMQQKDVLAKYDEGIAINQQLGNPIGSVRGLIQLLQYWFMEGNYEQAKIELNRAFSIASQTSDEILPAELYSWNAWLNFKEKNFVKALELIQQSSKIYNNLKNVDFARIWESQTLADKGYFEFHRQNHENAINDWKKALILIEKIPVISRFIKTYVAQLKWNLIILEDPLPVTVNLQDFQSILSSFTADTATVPEKIEKIEKALLNQLNSLKISKEDDPFKLRLQVEMEIRFDLGYLYLATNNLEKVYHNFEQAIDFASRLEYYEIITSHCENLQKFKIVSKKIQAYRENFYFLTHDEYDLSQEDINWRASWRSQEKSKDAFRIIKIACDLFDKKVYQESIELFTNAREIFRAIGETDKIQEMEDMIDSVEAVQVVEEGKLADIIKNDPEKALRIQQTIQNLSNIEAGQNKTFLEDDDSSILEGILNRDMIESSQFLLKIEENGRSSNFEKDHQDAFFKTYNKIDMALMMSDRMGVGDPLAKVEPLVLLGNFLSQNEEYNIALERLNEAYHITVIYGSEAKIQQASVHQGFGLLYYRQQNLDDGISHFEQSLRLYESIQNSKEILTTLTLLGTCHLQLNDHKQALFFYKQAINLPINEENAKEIGEILVRLAEQYEYHGKFQKSLSMLKKSLEIFNKYSIESTLLAPCYMKLAQLYDTSCQYDKAFEYYEKSAKKYKEDGNSSYADKILENLEKIRPNPTKIETKAIQYFQLAIKVWESNEPMEKIIQAYRKVLFILKYYKSDDLELRVCFNIGYVYFTMGNPFQVRHYLGKTLEILKNISSSKDYSDIKTNSEKFLSLVENPKTSSLFYENKIENLIKTENFAQLAFIYPIPIRNYYLNQNWEKLASSLNKFASITLSHGNKKEAIDLFLESAKYYLKLGNEEKSVDIRREMSILCYQNGMKDKALDLCLNIVDYYQQHDHYKNLVEISNFTGNIYSGFFNHEQSIKYHLITLNNIDKGDFPGIKLEIFLSLGYSYQQNGDLDPALQMYQDGLNYATERQNPIYMQVYNINSAEVCYFQGNYQKVETFSQEAIRLFEKVKNEDYLAITHSLLGDLYCDQGKFAKALDYYQRDLNYYQRTKNEEELIKIQLKYKICEYKSDPNKFPLAINDEDILKYEERENSETKIEILQLTTKILVLQKKLNLAVKIFPKIIQLCDQFSSNLMRAFALFNWGKIEVELQNFEFGKDKLLQSKKYFELIKNSKILDEIILHHDGL